MNCDIFFTIYVLTKADRTILPHRQVHGESVEPRALADIVWLL